MSDLFNEFTKPSYTDWVNKLKHDLKGQPEDLIQRIDKIEELNFNTYQHADSENTQAAAVLKNSFVRGNFAPDNQWENMATVIVTNEVEANKKALSLLNLGATALRFIIKNDRFDWSALTKDIQLQFIETTVVISSCETYFSIIESLKGTAASVFFELELSAIKENDWSKLGQSLKKEQRYTLLANGYSLQQCGATTWQEVGYAISVAHEMLVKLIHNGLTVDEAAACIHFNCGAGAHYFYEIGKIRALRILWARIIEEYQPEKNESYHSRIAGFTGFTNKSLKDPYTNLLRQTTEAMSLIFSGVHSICVQPYDAYSTKKETTLSTRMAVNIPLILKEESYFDKVIDPLGGSYAVEFLTNEIADKAWNLFQRIETLEGISTPEARQFIVSAVKEKAAMRIEQYVTKKEALIGITIFPNPKEEQNDWIAFDDYLGIKQLIVEQSL